MGLWQFIPIAVVLFSAGSLFAQGPQFTIQDLGTLPNLPACDGTALSQSGDVVGYCVAAPGQNVVESASGTQVFLYSKGTMTGLNLSGLTSPIPTGVNDGLIVVGGQLNLNLMAETASASPFIYEDGVVLPPSGKLQSVLPLGVNDARQMVGTSIQINSNLNSFFIGSGALLDVLSPDTSVSGTVTPLTAPNGVPAAAFAISPKGVIGGAVVGANATSVAPLIWQNQTPQTLPLLAGYPQGLVSSVNDSGMAAGAALSVDFTTLQTTGNLGHAVMWANGSVTDLGVLPGDMASLANSINSSGTVVGFSSSIAPDFSLQLAAYAYAPSSSYHAFIYSGGKMYDLTRQLVNGTGWQLSFATQINDAGQIVGSGIFTDSNGNTNQRAFLLTPVSNAPNITGIVGAGLSTPAVTNLSPNGIFTIFGTNLAAMPAGLISSEIVNNQLPTNLGGTCVESGTSKLGLFYVSPKQINAIAPALPSGLVAGPVTTTSTIPITVVNKFVTAYEISSTTAMVSETAVSPEFLYFLENTNGQNPVATIEPNGAYVGTPGLISGATFTPAKVGDVLTAFGVGWGATTSTDAPGTVASVAAKLTSSYSLKLGGMSMTPSYAGLSPDYAGLYQVDFTVPSGLSAGNQPLVLTVDGVQTSATAYIAIGN